MEPFIGSMQQADPWMHKEFITSGYRIGFSKNRHVFKSLFMWHNETSNTWTHLIGAFIFIWFMIYVSMFMSLPSMPAFPTEWCSKMSTEGIRDFMNFHGEILHPEPDLFHSFYNHHGEAFERVEVMLKESLQMLKAGK